MNSLLRTMGGIFLKFILAIFVFYLFLALIVIPVGSPWLIQSQASKLLNHPVSVGSVWFNPFLMIVRVNDLKITGTDKKVMVGFDKFWIDLSFLSLFKKVYHIESSGIDGLTVNAAILPGGGVNLLELVPKGPPQPAKTAGGQAAVAVPLPPLPRIIVDSFSLERGKISIVDQTITPNFSTGLSDIDIKLTQLSTDPGSQARVVISAGLGDKGKISAETLVKPFMQPVELESTFSLNDYGLNVLTPYVGKYTGRSLKEGKLDLKMDYRISGNKINARHKLLIQRFNFGPKVESKDALPLPFGLAVALLEDPQGRIDISLPVTGDMSQPEFKYFHLVGQVIKNFFLKLVTSPLRSLLSIMGQESGTEELGFVSFEPGKTELNEPAKEKLKIIVKVLKERPKLSLEINGSYDPEVDWKTIKTEAFDNEFKALRKQSAFTDFRLFEDMYKYHFGLQGYWTFARENKGKTEEELKTEIRRRVIEEGRPDKAALEKLSQARAKSVYDFIIAAGFESGRTSIGQSRQTQSSMGQIPLEFTLTVFEEQAAASDGQESKAKAD